MVITETKARRRTAPERDASSRTAIDECLFCHRTADRARFVVEDREHGYNVCEHCIDDCARTVACSCVC